MDQEMGNEEEFETKKWQEMGNETEFDTRNGRKWETRQDEKHQQKTRKTGEKTGKLQEIQKQDFDKTSKNAENGSEISTRFRELVKTETGTKTRSS